MKIRKLNKKDDAILNKVVARLEFGLLTDIDTVFNAILFEGIQR